MTVIYKYQLDRQLSEVELPVGATILKVDEQHGNIMLWALVDPTQKSEARQVVVIGTGNEIRTPTERLNFINTFFIQGGLFVFHAFEVLPEK